MVSAGVTGIEKGAFAIVGNASKTSAKTAGADFGTIMNQSLSNTGTDRAKTQQEQDFSKIKTNVEKAPKAEEQQGGENAAAPEAAGEAGADATAQTQESQTTGQAREAQEIDDAAPETMQEKLGEKIQQLLESIKEELKQKFNLTSEQVESLLAQLGIQMQDLLNTSDLTKFVAAATGQESVVDLLTQGELTQKLGEMTGFIARRVEEIAQEVKLPPQEVKEFALESYEPKEEVQLPILAMADGETQARLVAQQKPQEPEHQEQQHQTPEQAVPEERISVEASVKTPQEPEQQLGQGQKEKSESHSEPEKSFTQTVAGEMTKHIEEVFARAADSEVQAVNPAEVARQIIESVKVMAGRGLSAMQIQLNPEHLGKINLSVVSRDGMVTAQIVTENENARRAIEAQLATLRENFNQQGLKVEAVEVTVASHAFENNASLQKGDSREREPGERRRRGLKPADLEALMAEDASKEQQSAAALDENSSVEYTA